MEFNIVNTSDAKLTYELDLIAMTESVSKSDDKFGLRELIEETFELYREREHKKLVLNTNIQSSYPSYSNYFMMSFPS